MRGYLVMLHKPNDSMVLFLEPELEDAQKKARKEYQRHGKPNRVAVYHFEKGVVDTQVEVIG